MASPNTDKGVKQQKLSFLAGGNAKCTLTLEDSLAVSYKLNIFSAYNSAITLLGIYPKELRTYVYIKTYTQMFIAALFIIVQTWSNHDILQ